MPRPFAEVLAKVEAFDEHAEDVFEREVGLLDVHRRVGRDDDVDVRKLLHRTAVVAGVGDGVDAEGARELERLDAVLRVAGGGVGEQDVAGLAEGFDLALEDMVEGVVVADGGEDAAIGSEGDGAEGGAVDGEAGDELGGEVLGVGGGASVAADEQLVAGLHGVGGEVRGGDDGVVDGLIAEDAGHGGDGLGELAFDEIGHDAYFHTPIDATPQITVIRLRRTRYIKLPCLAQVRVVVGKPVLTWWGKDVEVDGVFEGFGGVRHVAGDDQNLALADDLFDGRTLFTQHEEQRSLRDVGYLFIRVLMAGHNATLLEFDTRKHGLRSGDVLPGEQGIELCGWYVGPSGVKQFVGHHQRVSQARKKGICDEKKML